MSRRLYKRHNGRFDGQIDRILACRYPPCLLDIAAVVGAARIALVALGDHLAMLDGHRRQLCPSTVAASMGSACWSDHTFTDWHSGSARSIAAFGCHCAPDQHCMRASWPGGPSWDVRFGGGHIQLAMPRMGAKPNVWSYTRLESGVTQSGRKPTGCFRLRHAPNRTFSSTALRRVIRIRADYGATLRFAGGISDLPAASAQTSLA